MTKICELGYRKNYLPRRLPPPPENLEKYKFSYMIAEKFVSTSHSIPLSLPMSLHYLTTLLPHPRRTTTHQITPRMFSAPTHVAIALWEIPWLSAPHGKLHGWVITAHSGSKLTFVRTGKTMNSSPIEHVLTDCHSALHNLPGPIWIVVGRQQTTLSMALQAMGYHVTNSFADENKAGPHARFLRKRHQTLARKRSIRAGQHPHISHKSPTNTYNHHPSAETPICTDTKATNQAAFEATNQAALEAPNPARATTTKGAVVETASRSTKESSSQKCDPSPRSAYWLPTRAATTHHHPLPSAVHIATDASTNPHTTGVICFVSDTGAYQVQSSITSASSNELELEAITLALKYALKYPYCQVTIHTDSQAAYEASEYIRTGGRPGRSWRGISSGARSRFHQAFKDLNAKTSISIEKVLGHAGDPLNYAADRIAYLAQRASSLPEADIAKTLWQEINNTMEELSCRLKKAPAEPPHNLPAKEPRCEKELATKSKKRAETLSSEATEIRTSHKSHRNRPRRNRSQNHKANEQRASKAQA